MARFRVQPAQNPAGSAQRAVPAADLASRRLSELFYPGFFLAY